MAYITVSADVDVDLEEFDTYELLEELEKRGMDYNSKYVDSDHMRELLETIWLKRRNGNVNYQSELDQLIYGVLGKVV
jgi:hypothetical protein